MFETFLRLVVCMSVLTLPACTNDPRDPNLPSTANEATSLLLVEDDLVLGLYDRVSPAGKHDVLEAALMLRATVCGVEITNRYMERSAAYSVTKLPPRNDGDPDSDEIRTTIGYQVITQQKTGDVPCDLIERIIENPWF
jgi:hypothetical protein